MQLNNVKFYYLTPKILFNINYLLAHILNGFKYCYLSAID